MIAYEHRLKRKLKVEKGIIEKGTIITITDIYPFIKRPDNFDEKKHCFLWHTLGHYMIDRKYLGEKILDISI